MSIKCLSSTACGVPAFLLLRSSPKMSWVAECGKHSLRRQSILHRETSLVANVTDEVGRNSRGHEPAIFVMEGRSLSMVELWKITLDVLEGKDVSKFRDAESGSPESL